MALAASLQRGDGHWRRMYAYYVWEREKKCSTPGPTSRGMGGWLKGHLIPRYISVVFNGTQRCIARSSVLSAGMEGVLASLDLGRAAVFGRLL